MIERDDNIPELGELVAELDVARDLAARALAAGGVSIENPLRELQLDMQRHLLGEESAVTPAIVDAPPLPAADRLAIYRNAYQVRLIDALHETYPVLHGLLGDEAWVELGDAFVAAHPSVFRSIRWYGRELADFLGLLHLIARRRFSPRSRCWNGRWRRYSTLPMQQP